MLAPVHHTDKEAFARTVRNVLRCLWLRTKEPRNTRPEYLEHLHF